MGKIQAHKGRQKLAIQLQLVKNIGEMFLLNKKQANIGTTVIPLQSALSSQFPEFQARAKIFTYQNAFAEWQWVAGIGDCGFRSQYSGCEIIMKFCLDNQHHICICQEQWILRQFYETFKIFTVTCILVYLWNKFLLIPNERLILMCC